MRIAMMVSPSFDVVAMVPSPPRNDHTRARNDRKADAAVRIAFEQSENILMRLSWLCGLPSEQQQSFIDRAWIGTPQGARKPADRATERTMLPDKQLSR
jgi:hypothetical protein